MDRWSVLQGTALAIDVTLRNGVGAVITTYAGTEVLAATLWPGGSTPSSISPSASWTTPALGLVRVSLTSTQTARLAPGRYDLVVKLTDSDVEGAYRATVKIDAAASAGTAIPAYAGSQGEPATVATVYCTDEDLYCRASFDYLDLCPRSQILASGVDGSFTAGDPWTLTSSVVNFAHVGLSVGNLLILTQPRSVFPQSGGLIMAVAGVSGSSCTLRRPGLQAGQGMPPVPAAALSGVQFSAPTYAPQIDGASYDANKFFGIDPLSSIKTPKKLYDPRELQQFVVLTVLRRQYISALKAQAGDFKLKLMDVSQELDDLKSRLTIHWGVSPDGGTQPASSVFSARTRR